MDVKCEILAPAGRLADIELLYNEGADAVYVGLMGYSSRPKSSDLSLNEIYEATQIAKKYNKKLYVATNAAIEEEMIDGLYDDIKQLDNFGVDAIIIADYGVMYRVSRFVNNAELHMSTLTGIYNSENIKWLLENNVKRLILSSDLFLDEIQAIIDQYPQLDYEIVSDGGVCFNSNRQCLLPHIGELNKYSVYCQHNYDIYDGDIKLKKARRIGNCPAKLHRMIGFYLGMGISSFKVEGRTNEISYIIKRIRQMKESKEMFIQNSSEIRGYMHYIRRGY